MTFEIFPAYRGLAKNTTRVDAPFICTVRKNRLPRDMPAELHARADEWFYQTFGVRYRSQAVFVTGSSFVAGHYAASERHIVRVLPLGEYSYCWSPEYSDLFSYGNGSRGLTIEEYLTEGKYRQDDLAAAVASKHEIMLCCERYVAIPTHLVPMDKREESTSLIIL